MPPLGVGLPFLPVLVGFFPGVTLLLHVVLGKSNVALIRATLPRRQLPPDLPAAADCRPREHISFLGLFRDVFPALLPSVKHPPELVKGSRGLELFEEVHLSPAFAIFEHAVPVFAAFGALTLLHLSTWIVHAYPAQHHTLVSRTLLVVGGVWLYALVLRILVVLGEVRLAATLLALARLWLSERDIEICKQVDTLNFERPRRARTTQPTQHANNKYPA